MIFAPDGCAAHSLAGLSQSRGTKDHLLRPSTSASVRFAKSRGECGGKRVDVRPNWKSGRSSTVSTHKRRHLRPLLDGRAALASGWARQMGCRHPLRPFHSQVVPIRERRGVRRAAIGTVLLGWGNARAIHQTQVLHFVM
jgi:hypothetical protein